MGKFRDLIAYQKSFKLAMEIFKLTVHFPTEEKYGLIIQIRKSSRSVCSCLAEGYRKRQYEAHFVAKISDADMETVKHRYGLTLLWQANISIRKSIRI